MDFGRAGGNLVGVSCSVEGGSEEPERMRGGEATRSPGKIPTTHVARYSMPPFLNFVLPVNNWI